MKKRDSSISFAPVTRGLPENFWLPASPETIRADMDEFCRQFGLMPELAEVLGLRQYLREDTLKSVN
jgi:hypothetical protein